MNRLCVDTRRTTADNAAESLNLLGSVARSHRAHEQEDDDGHGTDDNELALSGVGGTVLSPRAASLAGVLADLVGSELVVDETNQGNRVTEELGGSDGSLPEHHRGNHQEDILEDTAQGHDERRSFANLIG